MPRKERRSTFYEWTCDGPCDRPAEPARTFSRDEIPQGWLQAAGKVFHSRACADAWWDNTINPPELAEAPS